MDAIALMACLLLAPVAASPARAQGRAASPVPADYDQAQSLIGDKRYAEALDKLRRVTSERPDFAPGWFARGLAARRAGQCPDAIPAYRRYAELVPTEAEPYFGLGLCLRDTGDRAGAVVALRRFVELERRPGQEKWVETARGLIASLQSSPGMPTAPPAPAPSATPTPTPTDRAKANGAYEDAQRLRDRGQIDAALKKFADAVALDPDLSAAWAAWGELLIKLHRETDAVAVLRAAVDRSPQNALAWYELGFALRETGRYAEAVEAYRRYIPLRPGDPDPHYGLARALQKLGRNDEAARSFGTYLNMEIRPSEQRWIASARAELAALIQRQAASGAASASSSTPAARPAMISAPAATSPAPSAPPADRAAAPPR